MYKKEEKKSELELLKEENERLKQSLEIAKLKAENREIREEIQNLNGQKYRLNDYAKDFFDTYWTKCSFILL